MERKQELFIKGEFEKSFKIFLKTLYNDREQVGKVNKMIESAFKTVNSKHHNCLGDSIDESTHHIYMFLVQKDNHSDLVMSFTTYFIYLYLAIEKIEVIFNIIGLPEEYKKKHFQIFQKIKKWANFIKHPKAFVLCHDPYYILENDPKIEIIKEKGHVLINNDFIFKYYSGENNNVDLYKKLSNKSNVIVVVPSLPDLTTKFCNGILSFLNLLKKNEVYREILNDKTTIQDYFITDTSKH